MNAYTFSQSKTSRATSTTSYATSVLNSVPPQAYTRDTLVKAINWLSSQPQAVRERATSADLVVSHYLQACRRAELQNEAPVSGETFREDLKTLAEGLRKQFEDPIAPPHSPSMKTSSPVAPTPAPQVTMSSRSPSPSPLPAPGPVAPAPAMVTPPAPAPIPPPPGLEAASDPAVVTWQVDARSLAQAKTVQQRMNLGSEIEGLRLLITLGAERARELFPPKS